MDSETYKTYVESINNLNEHSWRVCRSFLQNHAITAPQLEGYTYFMDKLLPEIVQENSKIWVKSEQRLRRDEIWFSGVTVVRPKYYEHDGTSHDITPSDALRKKCTYECEIRADVHHVIYYYGDEEMESDITSQQEHKYRNIRLFFIPCMVRSRYCHWFDGCDVDPANVGAYFIIQGQEKSMIELQKMRVNFPVTRRISDDKTEAEIRSASGKWRSTSTVKFYAQTTSGGRVRLYVHVPFIQSNGTTCIDVPLCAIFKMLRIDDVDVMAEYIEPDEGRREFVRRALWDPCHSRSREEIIESLAMNVHASSCRDKKMKRNYVLHIFKSEFLPHCGVEGTQYKSEQKITSHGRWGGKLRAHQRPMADDETIDNECRTKALFIGFVVKRMIYIHMKELPEDDRDHYFNKRLDTPGPLLATILRLNFRGFLRQLPNALKEAANGFQDPITTIKNKASSLTNQMREPFKRGNWSMTPGVNNGVVQLVSRINPLATMALGRRVMLTLNKQGKIAAPRQVHLSQEGLLCPVETPEGNSCGLMLVLTLYSRITLGVPTVTMRRAVDVSFGEGSPLPIVEPIPARPVSEFETIVMVNGWPIGITTRPKVLHDSLLQMRRSLDMSSEVRLVWYQTEELGRYFHINSEGSCVMRPLLRADMLIEAVSILMDPAIPMPALWKKLETSGCVEFIDKEEESARRLIVAMRPNHLLRRKKYTHLQIDEQNILGCLASIIPYSDLNQSPRNMYFTSMCKAALALPSLDMNRLDMNSYQMWYPQKPLASTHFHDYMIEMSGGITTASVPIWCVACLHGRNMEDSIYVNKSSLDRGLFMMTYRRTFSCEARNKGTDEETFMVPPDSCIGRKGDGNYGKLQKTGKYRGIVAPGTQVCDGDVLIGKVARLPDQEFGGGGHAEVLQDRSIVMRKIGKGVVDKVQFDKRDGQKIVWVTIRCVRRPVVGDKFASFAVSPKKTLSRKIIITDTLFAVGSEGHDRMHTSAGRHDIQLHHGHNTGRCAEPPCDPEPDDDRDGSRSNYGKSCLLRRTATPCRLLQRRRFERPEERPEKVRVQ